MEEEVRQILARAVAAPERLGQLAQRLFGEGRGAKLEIQDRKTHEPMKLD